MVVALEAVAAHYTIPGKSAGSAEEVVELEPAALRFNRGVSHL